MQAGNRVADVLIIGGGITGCATAYHLARAGSRVVLLEKEILGFEGSGRNLGGIRQQMRDPLELPMVLEAVKRWRELDQELGLPTEYRTTGNIMVTYKEAEIEGLEEEAERQRGAGLDVRVVAGKELRELVPGISDAILAGMYSTGDGHVNPQMATIAFATAARRAGARILTGVEVDSIRVQGGKVLGVASTAGDFAADVVLCAAGVQTPGLCRPLGLDIPIVPHRQQVLITTRIPTRVTYPYLRCTGPRVGFMQTANGTGISALGPPDQVGFDCNVNPGFVSALTRELLRLVPALQGMQLVRGWAGWYEVTPDDLPIISPVPGIGGLIISAGYCGHGFAFGPALGMMLAELILRGESPIPIHGFRLSRFSEPGYRKAEPTGKLASLWSLTHKGSH